MRKLFILALCALSLAGCQMGRGGQFVTGTPDQREAERKIASAPPGAEIDCETYILASQANNGQGFAPPPECGGPPVDAARQPLRTDAQKITLGHANRVRGFVASQGGRMIFEIEVARGFRVPSYQTQVLNDLLWLSHQRDGISAQTALMIIQGLREVWQSENAFEKWQNIRGRQPPYYVGVSTLPRNGEVFEEIFLNTFPVARCLRLGQPLGLINIATCPRIPGAD